MKVGGQALADGVLMRTDRAWAIARADGSVEVGETPPRGRLDRVPGLRVLLGVVGALRLAFGRRRGRDRRLLWTLVAIEVVVVVSGRLMGDAADSRWTVLGLGAAMLVLLRLTTPAALWRYHGAEHKAVAAYERGVDLRHTTAVLACPRVHNRCGTNLVFLVLLCGLLVGDLPGLLQAPVFVASLAVSAEAVGLAASRPRAGLSRVLLVGGRALQRWVTTAEPTLAEQAVACRALLAVLEEESRAGVRDSSSRTEGVVVAA